MVWAPMGTDGHRWAPTRAEALVWAPMGTESARLARRPKRGGQPTSTSASWSNGEPQIREITALRQVSKTFSVLIPRKGLIWETLSATSSPRPF